MQTFRSFADLQAYAPHVQEMKKLEDIGQQTIDWVLDNHHLYCMSEIETRCNISHRKLVWLFKFMGIQTEFIYSATYTTPRLMGELRGRARQAGYAVNGRVLHRGQIFDEHLERMAVGIGFRVFDEYGNELVYPEENRPGYLATEYSNAMDFEPMDNSDAAQRVEPLSTMITMDGKEITLLVTDTTARQVRPEKKRSHKWHTGTIYFEVCNKGGNRGYSTRYVGEMTVHRQRYRFRSTNYASVCNWIRDMQLKYANA